MDGQRAHRSGGQHQADAHDEERSDGCGGSTDILVGDDRDLQCDLHARGDRPEEGRKAQSIESNVSEGALAARSAVQPLDEQVANEQEKQKRRHERRQRTRFAALPHRWARTTACSFCISLPPTCSESEFQS